MGSKNSVDAVEFRFDSKLSTPTKAGFPVRVPRLTMRVSIVEQCGYPSSNKAWSMFHLDTQVPMTVTISSANHKASVCLLPVARVTLVFN